MRAELKIVMEREKMVRDVPNFRFKRVTKISALLSFIHNFRLLKPLPEHPEKPLSLVIPPKETTFSMNVLSEKQTVK